MVFTRLVTPIRVGYNRPDPIHISSAVLKSSSPLSRSSRQKSPPMDSSPYGVLLEKTRLPQPPLQRYAVSALFRKLRTAPPHRGFESREGRDAVSLCLNSSYAAVLDQSVREICTLVTSRVLKFDAALVELQSALEGCESRFVDIFVKSIGFLCRWSFREDPSYLISRLEAVELHPFVRVRMGGFMLF